KTFTCVCVSKLSRHRFVFKVVKGRYFYKCSNGKLKPKGCVTEYGKQLDLWQSYEVNGYRMMCAIDKDNILYYKFTGCVISNKTYYPGDTWADRFFWYSCSPSGNVLTMEIKGCVVDGQRLKPGDEFLKGEFYFRCYRKVGDSMATRPVACSHNGRRFEIGDFLDGDKFWYVPALWFVWFVRERCDRRCFRYACSMANGRAFKKVVGCIHQKKRLSDGDRYFVGETIIECTIRKDTHEHRIVGCAQKEDDNSVTQRRVGCQWMEGNSPFRYIRKCVVQKDRVVTETVECYYEVRGGG
ncbi:unnamed protein product, partial [Soboliphyme baturini]|uniref:DUF3421 domain-containing protein n=1 Tax=Soboliphyme baturini TaxID=241478 RepID=A0A183IXQ6_9BILA